MKNKVLFLAHKMSMGFGVSVVVDQLSLELLRQGISVAVGCLESDGSMEGEYPIVYLDTDADALNVYVREHGITHVIAHTTPYFEILPVITEKVKRYAWEHGDPTPELFPFDGEERRAIANQKRQMVYPSVDEVIAISQFIRADISWPRAQVIYNGCNHINAGSIKRPVTDKLVVGTLVRLGKGEAFYKGNSLFLELVKSLSNHTGIEFRLMGRGTDKDAEPFRNLGVKVYLNATDDERSRYLAGIDIFVSMSLWEGFNLPLVEAAVSGALPLAFDTGAHPEVTPYIFSDLYEMASFIAFHSQTDRTQLYSLAERNKVSTKHRFDWKKSVQAFMTNFLE